MNGTRCFGFGVLVALLASCGATGGGIGSWLLLVVVVVWCRRRRPGRQLADGDQAGELRRFR